MSWINPGMALYFTRSQARKRKVWWLAHPQKGRIILPSNIIVMVSLLFADPHHQNILPACVFSGCT